MKIILLSLIFLYQHFISPLFGSACLFYPSCSEYAKLSLKKYRLTSALLKISLRILRCNSWNSKAGGVDWP